MEINIDALLELMKEGRFIHLIEVHNVDIKVSLVQVDLGRLIWRYVNPCYF